MSALIDKIVSEALELPPALRAFIAEKLIESLVADSEETLSPEWKAEIRKRCEEIDRGAAPLRESEVVFEKAYNVLS